MRGCRPLTDLEFLDLLEVLSAPGWGRERLLVLLGVRTGLRLSSMLQLRVGDVAIAGEVQARIRVRRVTTKGKRSGYDLPLHLKAAAALQEYLDDNPDRCFGDYLFAGRYPGVRLSKTAGWRALKRAFTAAGIKGAPTEIGSHTLRKTFARLLYAALREVRWELASVVSCWGVAKHTTQSPHMTNQIDSDLLNTVLQLLSSEGSSGFAEGLRLLVNEAMYQERSAVLQARPYERCEERLGHANGFKPKTLATRIGPVKFRIPQVRDGVDFYPSALEKGIRSEKALLLALAEMYVQGVSTRKVTKIVEELCGHSVSSTQVSKCAAKLDAELQCWRDRPLGSCSYMILDARYEKVRQGGQLLDCAVLIAIGIGQDGKRSVLGVSVALSEAEVHWLSFLASLQSRGLHGLSFIVSDAHCGLSAARAAVFPSVPWQRCQFHLQQNAQAHVPRLDMRAKVAEDIRGIFNCPDLASATARLKHLVDSYSKSAPKLSTWMEENIPQGLAVFSLPLAHQRRLRTSNSIERVNQELKRRTRVASLFPNEASLLRLISALLSEISDEWATSKIYLNMIPPDLPQI